MIASLHEIEALEKYFASADLPKEIYLNKAIKILDVSKFIQQNIANLKDSDIAEVIIRPRYNDLLLIKQILMKKKGMFNAGQD